MSVVPGSRVDSYELLEHLGSGGMGTVYRAHDPRLGRDVAIKFLKETSFSDAKALRRFEREARAASALSHPNIVTIHDIGKTDSSPYIVMEFLRGRTLRETFGAGPLKAPELFKLAFQVSDGLARAHEAGIVHRDLKPENLMLTEDGYVKILDFGLAKWVQNVPSEGSAIDTRDRGMTRSGAIVGTAAYMSPEQAKGEEVDFRSDQFSLGAILYEAASNVKPFRGASFGETLAAVLGTTPEPLSTLHPGLPVRFVSIVHRLLSKEPGGRYRSTRELVTELQQLVDSSSPALVIEPVERSMGRAEPMETHKTPRLPGGEKRQTTIAVAHLPGYGAMLESVDPETLGQWMRRLENKLQELVTSYGGVVNQFAPDGIVLLFGAPTADEDHFLRAVRAAQEIRWSARELAIDGHALPDAEAALSMGIASGAVVVQEPGDGEAELRIAGDALASALALSQLAGDGEILVSEETRRLVESFFETEPADSLRVKGKRITAHRLGNALGVTNRFEAGERLGLTRYAGRGEELAALHRCIERASSGDGQLVTVTGEAGVGKSRLIHEFQQRIDRRRWRLVQGAGVGRRARRFRTFPLSKL